MIKPIWKKMYKIRPKESGFYLCYLESTISFGFLYYDKSLDYIYAVDYDCEFFIDHNPRVNPFMDAWPAWDNSWPNCTNELYWAEMPRISKSEVLCNQCVEVSLCRKIKE